MLSKEVVKFLVFGMTRAGIEFQLTRQLEDHLKN